MKFHTCGACGRRQAYIRACHWNDAKDGWHYLVRCRACKRGYFTTERNKAYLFPHNDPSLAPRLANELGLLDTPRLMVDVTTPACCLAEARCYS